MERIDWKLDEDTETEWTSTSAHGARMSSWYSYSGNRAMLKDTQGGFYRNRMIHSNKFEYKLPLRLSSLDMETFVGLLEKQAALDVKTMEVDILSVAHARNHHLGQFAVVDYQKSRFGHHVVLQRFKTQYTRPWTSVAPFRSRSEARHLEVIRDSLPSTWIVMHEPDAVSHLDTPLVSGGKWCEWCGDGVTIDYVACSSDGLQRLCIESKSCSEDALDDVTIQKACALRDQLLTRVLIVYDHGRNLRWLDLGGPNSRQTPTCSSEFPVLGLK